jgi:hypothetical protein
VSLPDAWIPMTPSGASLIRSIITPPLPLDRSRYQ